MHRLVTKTSGTSPCNTCTSPGPPSRRIHPPSSYPFPHIYISISFLSFLVPPYERTGHLPVQPAYLIPSSIPLSHIFSNIPLNIPIHSLSTGILTKNTNAYTTTTRTNDFLRHTSAFDHKTLVERGGKPGGKESGWDTGNPVLGIS